MAFVLIQHLEPTHDSMLVDLLADHTPMRVVQAADGMPVEQDHVYVIPPGVFLSIRGGALRLSGPRERHGARMPFDHFLHSLADECGGRAICAVLSGTGDDGSLGLTAVKAKDGLVIAQDPEEAAFDGMPKSAIATSAVDLVLPVAGIAGALATYNQESRSEALRTGSAPGANRAAGLTEIIDLLRASTPHDLALYKPGTLSRRIERRMAVAAIEDTDRYLKLLREDSRELELLAKDLLIHVTSFFRDEEVFALLARTIVPDLVRGQSPDRPLRVWVPGCSTGEEAYSLAMLFIEEITATKRNIKLQIFASDADEAAVVFARDGLYPDTIRAQVSLERLGRFFVQEDHSYRVVRELRDTVVFAVHDLLAHAPFSRVDLLSCRNLLIYLQPEAQTNLLSLFHFAVRPGGILLLGTSETVGNAAEGFEPLSKKYGIYRHIGNGRLGKVRLPMDSRAGGQLHWPQFPRQIVSQSVSLAELSQRALLEAYAPASVLIDHKRAGLFYVGPTDRYLRVAPGEATGDLLAMAREGLGSKLRAAIRQAIQSRARIVVSGARVNREGRSVAVSIVVQPLQGDGQDLLLVSFVDEIERDNRPEQTDAPPADAAQIAELQRELEATRKELESTVRELELSNEELKAINEEATSVNEEYRSTNEELETSKEELQSLNEELTALNGQLHETIERQRATSNDLRNMLNSSDVAMVILDANLTIRLFTPAAKALFSIIASDVGRPLADLTRRFPQRGLLADARTVLAGSEPIRREIGGESGAWYIQRVLPYRTHDDSVDGVILTFTNISERKAAEREIQEARAYSNSIIDTIRQPLVVLDDELHVISASRSFYRVFATEPDKTVGSPLWAADPHHLDIPGLRGFLDLIRSSEAPVADYEIEIEIPPFGRRALLLDAQKIPEDPSAKRKTLVAIEDITERKRAEQQLQTARLRAEEANLGKSRFLAAVSHDLRQPLQTMSFLQGVLAKKLDDEDALALVVKLDETLGTMSGMLNTLLDINQMEAGVVRWAAVTFPLDHVFQQLRTEFAYQAEVNGLGWRVVRSGLSVRSDQRLLAEMIRNLVSNAMKYTKRGKVLLGCRRRSDKAHIEVWDTGIGIPEGQLRSIFEEFRQLENPAQDHTRGFGLGLAIAQHLGSLLGHAIDVRSCPGRGSVFGVEVPLGHADPERLPLPPEGETGKVKVYSGSILVIEDDPAVRSAVELLVGAEGHRVVSAADGREALALLSRGAIQPDIIVADYNLPGGLTGLQVTAHLRQTLRRETPVIILTGDISAETSREITRLGCAQLNKPAKAEELTNLVQRILRKSRGSDAPPSAPGPAGPAEGSQTPTVFVIDDDDALRRAMERLLQSTGQPVEVFANAETFLQEYRPGRTGCLVVDARLPDLSGVALLERLKAEDHQLPAIMLTGYGDVTTAVHAMKAGAIDFIEKPVRPDELLASIQRALKQTRDTAERSAEHQAAVARINKLTARERQILDLIIAGHANKEIAYRLCINQRTVENHRATVMKKTGTRSLPKLVRLVLIANDSVSPDRQDSP